MKYYVFNIGAPVSVEWWMENLRRGVITAGYNGSVGDRGDVILHQIQAGDWVIAYANRHGYVGAGIVQDEQTYRLHESIASLVPDHVHERGVDWRYSVMKLDDAVTATDAARAAPRQTLETINSSETAERLIGMLQQRSGNRKGRYDRLRWELASEAVRDLGRAASVAELLELILKRHPDYNSENLRADLEKLAVNSSMRHHYQGSKVGRRTDTGHPYDLLYKTWVGKAVRFELYDIKAHGVWTLAYDPQGRGVVSRLPETEITTAMERARDVMNVDQSLPIDPEMDDRQRALTVLAIRQGQAKFRAALMEAYEGRCAVTSCSASVVLEAAHIVPYRGPHSNRTDNGILLRSDIHTLFDLGRLWVEPGTLTINLSEDLRDTEYWQYHGQKLHSPADRADHPNDNHLKDHIRAATVEI
jgi:hypothetical protein